MEPYVFHVIAALLVIVGVAGTVLPLLPGTVLVFGGLLLAAWADGFARVGALGLAIIGFLAAASFVFDFAASLLGAKRAGASPQAIYGATIGALAGLLFGVLGLVVGPFVGAVAGEYLARRRLDHAGRVGLGTWLGLLVAAVAKVVIAFLMIAVYAAFYWLNAPAAPA